jgi:hypothetical protein
MRMLQIAMSVLVLAACEAQESSSRSQGQSDKHPAAGQNLITQPSSPVPPPAGCNGPVPPGADPDAPCGTVETDEPAVTGEDSAIPEQGDNPCDTNSTQPGPTDPIVPQAPQPPQSTQEQAAEDDPCAPPSIDNTEPFNEEGYSDAAPVGG